MPDPVRPVAPREDDHVCEHGTAMDVHCCNCHSGFIFDRHHECAPSVEDVLKAIGERAMLAASDPHADAAHYRKALADICNLALESQRLAVSPVPWAGSGAGMQEDLTRVDQSAQSEGQDLPRKPQPEGSQR